MFMGKRLSELRDEHNIGQKQLAAILGVKPNTVSDYENGVLNPSVKALLKMAEYFTVSIDYLMGLSDIRTPSTKKDILVLPKDYPPAARTELIEYAKYLQYKYTK